jgi:hypothetical protein
MTKNKIVVFIRSLLLMLFVAVHVLFWFTHVARACTIIRSTKSFRLYSCCLRFRKDPRPERNTAENCGETSFGVAGL